MSALSFILGLLLCLRWIDRAVAQPKWDAIPFVIGIIVMVLSVVVYMLELTPY